MQLHGRLTGSVPKWYWPAVPLVTGCLMLFGCSRSSPESDTPSAEPQAPAAENPDDEKDPDSPSARGEGASEEAVAQVEGVKQEGQEQEQEEPSAPLEEAPAELLAADAERGKELYARHCAACHGDQGGGKGIAAQYVFPKPRDLQAGRFRLVSTENNVPTREDLHEVLLRGMPGSSMPPWGHLPEQDREALVDEVRRLHRAGVEQRYVRMLREEEQLTDEEIADADVQAEIQEFVERFTTPGESTEVPDIEEPTAESIERGKEVYAKFGCLQCHGEDGKGDGVEKMVNDSGLPTSPRDFTQGIFKGGHDRASLYRRIAYGMPGTPMPGSSEMSPEDMIGLVHYIREMSTEEQRQRAILNREKIQARLVESVPAEPDAEQWSSVEPVTLRTTPLWWRDEEEPEVSVQALHDGQQIAIRLSWADPTQDVHAMRSEVFEDAVAVELSAGEAEPFLGMGDTETPIDVWFWDADRQGASGIEDSYPDMVVDQYPFSETVVASAELDREGARAADQPDVSLPARASGNPIVPGEGAEYGGGSALQAGGPGSVTFLIPENRLVSARGQWQDGRWEVVMTRPLAGDSEESGIALEPGGTASMAFAIWDGSRQDRDGKKRITIWQDLELEQQ